MKHVVACDSGFFGLGIGYQLNTGRLAGRLALALIPLLYFYHTPLGMVWGRAGMNKLPAQEIGKVG
ncbi:hypothetical protein GZ77_21490 [Endozoicomonas montiporae]|uniref:Uncharacterized protein n=1 Tax=Endozoicomonas montiporae TaxID=1027273 RepID=A0A081N3H3_9GAMM|nr:hypothetical protein GZ77_21490 [Endozoicomonas montiporae]